MPNIFIIGNGFDLAHGIHSTYDDFRNFLITQYYATGEKIDIPLVYSDYNRCSDIDVANLLVRLITQAEAKGYLWSDLEGALGRLDYTRFFGEKDADEYIEHVLRSLELAIPQIDSFFDEWIKKLNISSVKAVKSFQDMINAEEDFFITFNYTSVLEKIYGAKHVCHVHGGNEEEVLIGHGDNRYINIVSNGYNSNKKRYTLKKEKQVVTRNVLTEPDFRYILHLLNSYKTTAPYLKLNSVQAKLMRKIKNIRRDNKFLVEESIEYWDRENKLTLYKYNCQTGLYKTIDDRVEAGINHIHNSLHKDIHKELDNLITFISQLPPIDYIENVYSIGFSYSDVDLKVIKIIALMNPVCWYLHNYDPYAVNIYKRKISKLGYPYKSIHTFTF